MTEKRVYVCECKDDFDFRTAEWRGDFKAIKKYAQENKSVYSLKKFQDAVNDEELDLTNSFILIV